MRTPAFYRPDELYPLLATHAGVQQVDGASWKLDGEQSSLTARAQRGWLVLDADATPGEVNGHAWSLLERCASLPPGVKLVVPAGDDAVRVRAELPLDRTIALDRLLARTIPGVLASTDWLPKAGEKAVADAPKPCPRDDDLVERIRDAGWRGVGRAHGPVHVDLGVAHSASLARVARRADASIELSVDLEIDATDGSGISSRATALLLLRTAAGVRLVRAASSPTRPRFEVLLEAEPEVAVLAHALSALEVACKCSAREARAMQSHETIARRYLESTAPAVLVSEPR